MRQTDMLRAKAFKQLGDMHKAGAHIGGECLQLGLCQRVQDDCPITQNIAFLLFFSNCAQPNGRRLSIKYHHGPRKNPGFNALMANE